MGSTSTNNTDFEPWDGTSGEPWEKFELRLMNYASKSDDRGWSLADHLQGIDEGTAGIPLPAAPAENRKATMAQRKRQKEAYGLLTRHITHPDIILTLSRNHFQQGRPAYLAVRAVGLVAVDRLRESTDCAS